jgi:hypothetical protein
MSTQRRSAASGVPASASTWSHPFISRPRMTKRPAPGSAASASVSAGSTRSSSPPWPAAATAMLPLTRNASPPNMRFSVRPATPWTATRMLSASSSS